MAYGVSEHCYHIIIFYCGVKTPEGLITWKKPTFQEALQEPRGAEIQELSCTTS